MKCGPQDPLTRFLVNSLKVKYVTYSTNEKLTITQRMEEEDGWSWFEGRTSDQAPTSDMVSTKSPFCLFPWRKKKAINQTC